MNKKNMKLSIDAVKKNQGYISGGIDSLIKEVSKLSQNENMVRMNFEVSEELRNLFKSKTAKEGKRVKDVLISLMKNYVEN